MGRQCVYGEALFSRCDPFLRPSVSSRRPRTNAGHPFACWCRAPDWDDWLLILPGKVRRNSFRLRLWTAQVFTAIVPSGFSCQGTLVVFTSASLVVLARSH